MKTTHVLSIGFTLIGTLIALIFCEFPTYSQEQQETAAVVYFEKGVEVNDAIQEMARYSIRTTMIMREYVAGKHTYVAGLNVEQDEWRSVEELRALFWQSHGAMITDQLNAIDAQSSGKNRDGAEAESWQDFVTGIQAAAEEFVTIDGCWETLDCPDVILAQLSAFGTPEAFQKLEEESEIVANVEVLKDGESKPTPNQADPEVALKAVAAASSISTWLPSTGSITLAPSGVAGHRYVSNTVRWQNTSGFDATAAYEHDFFSE